MTPLEADLMAEVADLKARLEEVRDFVKIGRLCLEAHDEQLWIDRTTPGQPFEASERMNMACEAMIGLINLQREKRGLS